MWSRTEPDLYFNTRVDDVETENDRIQSGGVTQHSIETGYRLSTLFVDATSDAFIAEAAGAEFRIGREGHDEFGEHLAPEVGDSKTLPSALYLIAHRRETNALTPPVGSTSMKAVTISS